jgi:hypothetical protein
MEVTLCAFHQKQTNQLIRISFAVDVNGLKIYLRSWGDHDALDQMRIRFGIHTLNELAAPTVHGSRLLMSRTTETQRGETEA